VNEDSCFLFDSFFLAGADYKETKGGILGGRGDLTFCITFGSNGSSYPTFKEI
jgi:hypothetical protein